MAPDYGQPGEKWAFLPPVDNQLDYGYHKDMAESWKEFYREQRAFNLGLKHRSLGKSPQRPDEAHYMAGYNYTYKGVKYEITHGRSERMPCDSVGAARTVSGSTVLGAPVPHSRREPF